MKKNHFIFNPVKPAVKALRRFAPVLLFALFFMLSCSDDNDGTSSSDEPAPSADTTVISLTYHNFSADDDILILDADTTQLSVSKTLAETLCIKHFTGRPLAVWQKINRLPFIRRAVSEAEDGDRIILTVDNSASLADVLPADADISLDTKIFVNQGATNALTSAGGTRLVEDISSQYMEGDTIHPAVILYTGTSTDQDGTDDAGNDVAAASDTQTGIPQTGEYEYETAEDIYRTDVDWSIINKKTTISSNFKLDSKADVSIGLNIPVETRVNVKIDIKTKWFKLKKFDMGVYGGFSFKPEVNIGFTKEYTIPKDKGTKRLISFPGYTAVFMVGVVPVSITLNPGIIFRIDGTLKGSVNTGFTYRYENDFKAGVKYEGSWQAYGNYTAKENKFVMNAVNANAQLQTGVGFYLSVDALLYGFAGPEIAVGPRLGLNANAAITIPTHGDPSSQFNANLNFGLKALIGAKLKVWKWTLADWNTTFAISPEWEIWHYSTTL